MSARSCGGKFARFSDCLQHFGLARIQILQVRQAFVQIAQRHVADAAGGFLAVSCDERNGVAIVDERDNSGNLFFGQVEFMGKGAADVHDGGPHNLGMVRLQA